MLMADSSLILDRLRERLPDAVVGVDTYRGDASALVQADRVLDVARVAKDDPALRFDLPLDVTAVDYIGREPRFEVVYHLYSTTHNHRLRLKTRVSGNHPTTASVTPVWL